MIWPGLIAALLEAADAEWSFTVWHDNILDEKDEYMVSCLKLFMVRVEEARGKVRRIK